MQIYEKHPGLPSHLKMFFYCLFFWKLGFVGGDYEAFMRYDEEGDWQIWAICDGDDGYDDGGPQSTPGVDCWWWWWQPSWATTKRVSGKFEPFVRRLVVGDTYRKLCNGDEKELFIVKMIRLMLQQMVNICIIKIMTQFSMFHFKFENFIPCSLVLPSWSAGPLWWANTCIRTF